MKLKLSAIGQRVVWPKRALGHVIPPVCRTEVLLPGWIEWIKNATALFFGFTANQQVNVLLAIIDEAMANPGTYREGGKIAAHHTMQATINPSINLTLQDINEFFLVFFSMRPR
ncbi:MAG: hypothetical protein L0H70_02750 [Xanthomonadales bacterium]|nr:hypothetical protein [Xanthomonadales bacterium]